MKKDIGFLAIGQAGGNIGKLFEMRQFNVMYVNTSVEDLQTLSGAKHLYHITGGEGAARDRNRAKDLVAADIQDLEREITRTFSEEFIFTIFSAGGGTGSGSAPMLMDYLSLQMPGRKIGGITILPSAGESIRTQINAYECLSELEQMKRLSSIFVLDNNGKPDKFALNESFVDLFMTMLDIPAYTDTRGNIDTKELKEVLSTRGCIVISSLPGIQSSTPKLADSFHNTIFARMEQDDVIRYAALSMASEINTESLFNSIGKPLDLFQGYNREKTICVLSGLSFPYSRLEDMNQQIAEDQEAMKKVWTSRKQALGRSMADFSFMDENDNSNTASNSSEILRLYKSHSK